MQRDHETNIKEIQKEIQEIKENKEAMITQHKKREKQLEKEKE